MLPDISVAYIFINGLFNNAVSSSECTAMNGRMTSESVIGKMWKELVSPEVRCYSGNGPPESRNFTNPLSQYNWSPRCDLT
jgi:hypothetical protein